MSEAEEEDLCSEQDHACSLRAPSAMGPFRITRTSPQIEQSACDDSESDQDWTTIGTLQSSSTPKRKSVVRRESSGIATSTARSHMTSFPRSKSKLLGNQGCSRINLQTVEESVKRPITVLANPSRSLAL